MGTGADPEPPSGLNLYVGREPGTIKIDWHRDRACAADPASLPTRDAGLARYGAGLDIPEIEWCDGGYRLKATILRNGLSPAEQAALRSLRRTDDPQHRFAVDVPPGMGAFGALTRTEQIAWRYEGGARWLLVRAEGSEPDVRRAFDFGQHSGLVIRDVTVAGRRAWFANDDNALHVQWDDHTLVTLQGAGLSDDELIAAGNSLGPADPALATPEVDGSPRVSPAVDPGAPCPRLGLCG
jgi:hypothetical protein